MNLLKTVFVIILLAASQQAFAATDCNRIASNFSAHLWQCWNSNSQGCIPYYINRMPASDLQSCRRELHSTCIDTCYSRWGHGDTLCYNGCNRI